jgi:hypothetical protein
VLTQYYHTIVFPHFHTVIQYLVLHITEGWDVVYNAGTTLLPAPTLTTFECLLGMTNFSTVFDSFQWLRRSCGVGKAPAAHMATPNGL